MWSNVRFSPMMIMTCFMGVRVWVLTAAWDSAVHLLLLSAFAADCLTSSALELSANGPNKLNCIMATNERAMRVRYNILAIDFLRDIFPPTQLQSGLR